MRKTLLALAISITIGAFFFATVSAFDTSIQLHGDESYDIGRAMQNLEFLAGQEPATFVWFSEPNHPFTGEFIIGLVMLAEHQAFLAPSSPWFTNLTSAQIIAGRTASNLAGSFGFVALIFLASSVEPLIAPVLGVFMASSPGFLEFSAQAFLDIFLSIFCTCALACLYFFVVKKSHKALYGSAAFLGLSLGSKTSWDPIVATIVAAAAILLVENTNRQRLIRLCEAAILTFVAFASTSWVILVRLVSHLQAVEIGAGRNFSFSNLLIQQSMIYPYRPGIYPNDISHYSLFLYQTIGDLVAFLVVVGVGTSILLYHGLRLVVRDKEPISVALEKLRDNSISLFFVLVITFCALDLILTGSTFEYGRNYQRFTLYEAVAIFASLLYVKSVLPDIRRMINAAFVCLGFLLTAANLFYWESLSASLSERGSALLASSQIPPYSPIVGGAVLVLMVSSLVLFIPSLSASVVSGILESHRRVDLG
jgi:hypothetical protein